MSDGPKRENYHDNPVGYVRWCFDYCGWYMLLENPLNYPQETLIHAGCAAVLEYVFDTPDRELQLERLDWSEAGPARRDCRK